LKKFVGLMLLDDGFPIRLGHAIREPDVTERAAGHFEPRTTDRPDEV